MGLVFAAGIGTPLTLSFMGSSDDEGVAQRERRFPAPVPELPKSSPEWLSFPRSFDAWYGERFGLRNPLLRAYQRLELDLFERSPTDTVMLGKDGWLYLSGEGRLDANSGARPFSGPELAAWREMLEARHAWLASRGIDYVFVLVPGKAVVYPDHLPAAHQKRGTSRRDQFLKMMREETGVPVIDLAPALIAEREWDRPGDHVYFPLGSHWTGRGAAAGYRALMDALPAKHRLRPTLSREEFRAYPALIPDDLSELFCVDAGLEQAEFGLRAKDKDVVQRVTGEELEAFSGISSWRHTDQGLTRALLIHDSFGDFIYPMLAHQFAFLHRLSTIHFSPTFVESLQPDIVIDLYVDHRLALFPPHPQRVFEQADLAEQFRAAGEVLASSTGDGDAPGLVAYRETEIEIGDDGTHVSSTSPGIVVLPPFAREAGASTLLRLEMTSPVATYLLVCYPDDGDPTYELKRGTNVPLRSGRQTIYVDLPASRVRKQIALRPLRIDGGYWIHDFEIRRSDSTGSPD